MARPGGDDLPFVYSGTLVVRGSGLCVVTATGPASEIGRIGGVLATLLGTPMALVSLVDSERQWFKSCVGLAANETPRDVSFCGHAIHRDEALVVRNALADPRFADNPLSSCLCVFARNFPKAVP